MYAIIESGGKQYRVQPGDVIYVEKLNAEEGAKYTFSNVLAVGEGDGLNFGKPYLKGASVAATVMAQGKEKKVIIYKFKSKKGFHKKRGHRQPFTSLKIDAVNPA